MHYILFPKKDAVIYSKIPSRNYGLDPILELKKVLNTPTLIDNTRILIQFDINDDTFKTAYSASGAFYLNLYAAKAYNLPIDYTIEVAAVSQSWNVGTGKYTDSTATTDGVSWTKRTALINWINPGADYIPGTAISHAVTYDGTAQSVDLRIDVTEIVTRWMESDYTNNGFIIKRPDIDEQSTGSYAEFGNLVFFSTDSHTVYLPTLEAAWDDSIYTTGSSQVSTLINLSGSLSDNGIIIGNVSGSGVLTQTGQSNINITGSETGNIIVYTTLVSSSVSQQFDNNVIGHFEGEYSGSIAGYLSGSVSGSDMTGSLSGSITASFLTNYTGSIYLYVSGTMNGYLIGSASNATIYYYQSESALSDFTGNITGSSVGTFTGTYSGGVNGTVSGSTFISASFTNIMAGKSFDALESEQISIVLKNLKPQYKYQTKARFRLTAKDTFQRKTFLNTAASEFQVIKYLPIQSYYSIVDAYSNRIIIPFSNYTKISCDLNGNFFNLDLHGFMPERFYKIIFKTTVDETEVYIDNNYTFKVVK